MKTLTKLLIFILAIPSLLFLTSCPPEPEKNPDVPVYVDADFIGAWKCIDDSEIYYVLLKSNGSGKWVNEDLEDDEITSASIDWYYNDGSLTVRFPKFTEKYVVVKLTENLMTLRDEWGDMTFKKIKASDIPNDSDDPNDPDNPDDPDDPNDPDDPTLDCQIKTVSADPDAYSATLTGSYMGNKLPSNMGIEYSYDSNFPKGKTKGYSTSPRFGTFSVTADRLVDLAKVYYRAFAVIDGETRYGETKSFETLQGTYTIDGKTYKFIKVTGLPTGSFSMMQTELPPNAEVTVNGQSIGRWIYNNFNKNPAVTSGETREFFLSFSKALFVPRFPTREEWQYAYSGGAMSQGYKYSGSNDIDEVAWYSANSNGKVRTPAQKKPNELGFYDMSGNYAELCSNYDDELLEYIRENYVKKFVYYFTDVSAGYYDKSWYGSGAYGGCWSSSASDCQSFSTVSGFYPNTGKFDGEIFTARLVYSRPD